jgi:hypothetical protein
MPTEMPSTGRTAHSVFMVLKKIEKKKNQMKNLQKIAI